MSIEHCANFVRYQKPKPPYLEVQVCRVKGSDMKCGGWSDGCPIPKSFIPSRALPVNGVVTFKKEPLIICEEGGL